MPDQPLGNEFYRRYQAGDFAGAEGICRQALRRSPRHAEAIYMLGVIAQETGRIAEALQFIHQAAQIEPSNAVYVNAEGEAYLNLGRTSDALACFQKAVAARPTYERVHNNLGRYYHAQGDVAAAMASFREAIRLNPKYPTAHNNLGAALQSEGNLQAAAGYIRQALALRRDYPEAHFNLGVALHGLGDPLGALASLQEAIRLRPNYTRAHAELGQVLVEIGQVAASVPTLQTVVRLNPRDATGFSRLGNVLVLLDRLQEAGAVFDEALRLKPDNPEAFVQRFRLNNQLCDWSDYETGLNRLRSFMRQELDAGKTSPLHPLHAMSLPFSGAELLEMAQSHARAFRNISPSPMGSAVDRVTGANQISNLQSQIQPSPRRIAVGYLSRDFYDHPVGHLIHPLFGLHDRSRFSIHAYSFGPNDSSPYRQRIEADCEHFHDVTNLSTADLVQRIGADGVDILVDLMGYTGLARTACFARRAAPIQVNWLGYPGTMGADFIDYILGDSLVTPIEHANDFPEQIVRLPHSYMITDHRQTIAAAGTRAEHGLPAEGIVFCCFNNAQKIDPSMFTTWMKILSRTAPSVAWLSVREPAAQANLRREAEKRGIDPNRLIFAGHVKDKSGHLARQGLADLFLDTRYYNAHATAADALWAGLPLITCRGKSFAARAAASLLTAIGLAELVTSDLEEYETLAVRLALDPTQLHHIREKLAAARTTAPLFDTPLFVRNLERAYTAMCENHRLGKPPAPIDL